MSADLLSWLRSVIEGDKAAAIAADKASPGPWVNRGQAGEGSAWQIHGALTDDSETEWDEERQDVVNIGIRVATLNYSDGGGVWEREAADHIVLQQPRDTIARCTAELALLDEHPEAAGTYLPNWAGRCQGCGERTPCTTVKLLASGRRHRPGFNPEWVSE
ncbi:DUF6221 family protein [Nonomuraea sp. NPDC003560]|uniref:DUF6221 family protein n=1 Tax=Nonomuraea sp. NPDC003560 TaxID=3364341 RepID=UPI0036A371CC